MKVCQQTETPQQQFKMGTIKLMVRNLSSSSLTSLSSSSSSSSECMAVSASAAAWKYKQMEVEIARAEANSSRIRKLALAIAALASVAALLVVLVSASKQQQRSSDDDTGGGRLLRHLTISFRGGHYEANNLKDKKSSSQHRTKNNDRGNNNNYAVMHGVCKKDKDCSNPGECCSIHNYCGTGTEYCTKGNDKNKSSKKKRKKQENNDNNNESDNKYKQKMMNMEKKKKEKKSNNNDDKQKNNNESDKTKLKKMTKKQKKKEKKIKMRKSQIDTNTSTNDKKKKQDQEKVKGMDNNISVGGGGIVTTSFFSGCAQGRCCTPREVAAAVKMSSYEGDDLNDNGRSYCVAAVAVAFGESYDTPNCPGYIDSMASNVSNSDVRGVWQMSQGNGAGSITDQAKKLWIKYVGNQDKQQEIPEYNNAYCFNTGSWAIKTPIPGLPSGGTKWLFCTGAFTGTSHGGSDYYSKFIGQATTACAGL